MPHQKSRRSFSTVWDKPEVTATVLQLFRLGVATKVISELVHISEDRVKDTRREYGADIDRPRGYGGWPGNGDYEMCKFCKKRVRMPCTACVIKAMRKTS